MGETRRFRPFTRLQWNLKVWTLRRHSWPHEGSSGRPIAVIRSGLVGTPTPGSCQLDEQALRFFQIGGVEALGEPAVDWREQVTRFGPPALFAP
jgi:hypothetical protein